MRLLNSLWCHLSHSSVTFARPDWKYKNKLGCSSLAAAFYEEAGPAVLRGGGSHELMWTCGRPAHQNTETKKQNTERTCDIILHSRHKCTTSSSQQNMFPEIYKDWLLHLASLNISLILFCSVCLLCYTAYWSDCVRAELHVFSATLNTLFIVNNVY